MLILKNLATTEEGKLRLSRSFRDGEARGDGVLEDYSFFIDGLIDLYEAVSSQGTLRQQFRCVIR